MIIATLTPSAVFAAVGLAILFYMLWGWLGALFGLVVGYGTGVYLTQWYGGVPLSAAREGLVVAGGVPRRADAARDPDAMRG